jgi:hypothetical protein
VPRTHIRRSCGPLSSAAEGESRTDTHATNREVFRGRGGAAIHGEAGRVF